MIYQNIKYWRFEVVYSFKSIYSMGLSYFIRNSPPENGTCTINPLNGTTTTIFTIICSNWFDLNGIKDYSFYSKLNHFILGENIYLLSHFLSAWTTDPTNLLFLGSTTDTIFQVRMPIGDLNSSLLNIIAYIRDEYDCVTKINISSISIIENEVDVNEFLSLIQSTTNNSQMSLNPLIRTLYGSGNENDICQWLISIAKILNNRSKQNLLTTISSI